MNKYTMRWAAGAMCVLAMSGCASTGGGGDQMSNTVYATHRIVRNLEQNLGDSVAKLNETAAGLESRVEQTEEQSRRLQGIVEENRMKLDRLQSDLARLSDAIYRHFGLSTTSSAAPLDSNAPMYVDPEGVVVEEPGAERPEETAAAPEPQQTVIPSQSADTMPEASGGGAIEDYKRAQKLLLDKQYDQALAAFQTYLNEYPENGYSDNAQFWTAQCLLKLERYRDAVIAYDQTIERFPQSEMVSQAHYYKGLAFLRLGQSAKGRESLQHVITSYPGTAIATQAQTVLDEMNT